MVRLLRFTPPREQWLIFGLYVLLACIITFPAVATLGTHVIGGSTGDNYEMLRHVWWFSHALKTGQPLYYQSLMGYPDGFPSLILAAVQLQYTPMTLLALVLPVTLAYNIVILLAIALNGWSAFWLARALLGRENGVPAFLAGVVYASAPLFQGHLFDGHAGLLMAFPTPLFVWALIRLVQAERQVWAWGLAVILLFNLVPSGHSLQVIYVLMPIVSAFLLWLIIRRDWRGGQRVIVVCGLASVFFLIFMSPMISETLSTTAYTDVGGVVRYSADLLSIVSPSFFHPMWGFLSYPAQVLGTNLGEGIGYVGVWVALLVVLALWRKRESRWWGWLWLVAWMLSLGSLLKVLDSPILINLGDYQTHVPLWWAWVQDITGFSLARTPARFNFTAVLALAMMAGYGFSVFWAWGKRWDIPRGFARACAVLLMAGIVWDVQVFFPMPTRETTLPQALYDLQERDDVRAVFDVPNGHLLAAKDALYYQTAHQKPLMGGQVTRQTPVNPAKLNVLEASLNPALLREYGADVVVFHKARAKEIDAYDSLLAKFSTWGAPFYEDETLALYNVPRNGILQNNTIALSSGGTYETAYVADVYVAQRQWLDFTAVLEARGRDVTLLVDGVAYRQWRVEGRLLIDVPLPLEQRGFYRVELRLDPPCVPNRPETLLCNNLTVTNPSLKEADLQVLKPFIVYDKGVTLVASSVQVEDALEVRLWWRFDEPLPENAVRFVHVLNASGINEVQLDSSIEHNGTVGEWLETVRLPLEGLIGGEYSVRVGWYTFDTLERFTVLDTRLIGARDNAPQISTFRR